MIEQPEIKVQEQRASTRTRFPDDLDRSNLYAKRRRFRQQLDDLHDSRHINGEVYRFAEDLLAHMTYLEDVLLLVCAVVERPEQL